VSSKNYRFIASDIFFFFLSFLSPIPKKLKMALVVVDVSEPILLVLIFFILVLFSFVKVFICFQFNPSILICTYNIFQFNSSTFD
jgi:hypothetical protein